MPSGSPRGQLQKTKVHKDTSRRKRESLGSKPTIQNRKKSSEVNRKDTLIGTGAQKVVKGRWTRKKNLQNEELREKGPQFQKVWGI